MTMPLVEPLPTNHDPEVLRLAEFFNTTLGFAPNSVLTMMRKPALALAFTELNRAVMADTTSPATWPGVATAKPTPFVLQRVLVNKQVLRQSGCTRCGTSE
jgi:hypothetical protein